MEGGELYEDKVKVEGSSYMVRKKERLKENERE